MKKEIIDLSSDEIEEVEEVKPVVVWFVATGENVWTSKGKISRRDRVQLPRAEAEMIEAAEREDGILRGMIVA